MVVHDLRNPADAIYEGLKQADVIMDMAFNEMFEMTNAHFSELLQESSKESSSLESPSPLKKEAVSSIKRRMLLAKWDSKKQLNMMKENLVQK